MFKTVALARLKTRNILRNVQIFWFSDAPRSNYEIKAIREFYAYMYNTLTISRKYEDMVNGRMRWKRILAQVLLFILEFVLLLRCVYIFVKRDKSISTALGDCFVLLGKGGYVMNFIVAFGISLLAFLRWVIFSKELLRHLDWMYEFQPFASPLSNIDSFKLTHRSYRLFRVKALLIIKMTKLSSTGFIAITSAMVIFLSIAMIIKSDTFVESMGYVIWSTLLLLWAILDFTLDMNVIAVCFLYFYYLKLRYSQHREKVLGFIERKVLLQSNRQRSQISTLLCNLIIEHNDITVKMMDFNRTLRYGCCILTAFVFFNDVLFYCALFTNGFGNELVKYLLVLIAFQSITFTSFFFYCLSTLSLAVSSE